jgi:hypothetical protein
MNSEQASSSGDGLSAAKAGLTPIPGRPRGFSHAVWRPAGLIYVCFLLAGLLAGLWPDAVYPPRYGVSPAPLPTLRTILLAQIAFALLVQPLVYMRRGSRGQVANFWVEIIAETAAMFVVAAPFYYVAAYLGDATLQDALRTAAYAACIWFAAWAVSAHAWQPGGRARLGNTLGVVAGFVMFLGLPAAYYLGNEFLWPTAMPWANATGAGSDRLQWLYWLTPALQGWDVAASRTGQWLPQPLWAAMAWPGAAICERLLRIAVVRPR